MKQYSFILFDVIRSNSKSEARLKRYLDAHIFGIIM